MCIKFKLEVILFYINVCKGNKIYWNKYYLYGVIRVLEWMVSSLDWRILGYV